MPQPNTGFRVWRELPASARTLRGEAVRVGADSYEFTDDALPAEPVDYWLPESMPEGSQGWYGPARLPAAAAPTVLRLHQNEPNPVNPRTTFRCTLPHAGRVRLAVYDLRGARVATLVDADLAAGEWSAAWDGRDARGIAVSSGVYIAKLEAQGGTRTIKVTVMK